MHGTTIKIIGKWNVWVKISQSDHTYILPRTLSILTYIYFFLQFKFYQLRTLLFYFNHVMTFVRCSPWRWPQKTAETCSNTSIFEILQNKLEINLLFGNGVKVSLFTLSWNSILCGPYNAQHSYTMLAITEYLH